MSGPCGVVSPNFLEKNLFAEETNRREMIP